MDTDSSSIDYIRSSPEGRLFDLNNFACGW
jgi:hypothetical protein